MKYKIILSLLVAFSLNAAEKTPDVQEYQISGPNRAATISGNLDGTNTFDRVFGDGIDSGCAKSSTDSANDGVSYQVFPFYSPTGEAADIEVVLPSGSSLGDTLLFVYCSFNPTAPADNIAGIDDDGGVSFASAITPADGLILDANTTYFAVVAGYDSTEQGNFDLVFGGNIVSGRYIAPPSIVPATSTISLVLFGLMVLLVAFGYSRRKQNT